MKKIFFLSLAIVCFGKLNAMEVMLPSEEDLNKIVTNAFGEHFVKKTNLAKDLAKDAGKKKHVLIVNMAVNNAVESYREQYNKGVPIQQKKFTDVLLNCSRETAMKALLKDSPDALKFLQEKGILDK